MGIYIQDNLFVWNQENKSVFWHRIGFKFSSSQYVFAESRCKALAIVIGIIDSLN